MKNDIIIQKYFDITKDATEIMPPWYLIDGEWKAITISSDQLFVNGERVGLTQTICEDKLEEIANDITGEFELIWTGQRPEYLEPNKEDINMDLVYNYILEKLNKEFNK